VLKRPKGETLRDPEARDRGRITLRNATPEALGGDGRDRRLAARS
jgi:hypothetical protein